MNKFVENGVIAELDKIYILYNESEAIKTEIPSLILKKESEMRNLKDECIKNIRSIKEELQNKFISDVKSIRDNIDSSFGLCWAIPSNWAYKKDINDLYAQDRLNKKMSSMKKEGFYDNFRVYDKMFLQMLEECKKRKAEEIKKYKTELNSIALHFDKTIAELEDKEEKISKELYSTTIIAEDFFADAARISEMLKKGRADSVKEAINLTLDEKRKEEEEQRRREEARMQALFLETQAMENRMHNEAMQRAAEAQARAIREQNAAIREQNAAMEKALKTQKEANEARCVTCANRFKCSYERKQSNNCSSYIRS